MLHKDLYTAGYRIVYHVYKCKKSLLNAAQLSSKKSDF